MFQKFSGAFTGVCVSYKRVKRVQGGLRGASKGLRKILCQGFSGSSRALKVLQWLSWPGVQEEF